MHQTCRTDRSRNKHVLTAIRPERVDLYSHAFHPGGTQVALAYGDGVLRVLDLRRPDLATDAMLGQDIVDLNQLALGHCQFSATGATLACFGCPAVSLWSWDDLQLADYTGPTFTVTPSRHPQAALNQASFLTSGALAPGGRQIFIGDSGGGLSGAYLNKSVEA